MDISEISEEGTCLFFKIEMFSLDYIVSLKSIYLIDFQKISKLRSAPDTINSWLLNKLFDTTSIVSPDSRDVSSLFYYYYFSPSKKLSFKLATPNITPSFAARKKVITIL